MPRLPDLPWPFRLSALGQVDEDQRGVAGREFAGGLLAAMAAALVHHPEDAQGGAVRLLGHHLVDQPD